MFDDDVWGVVWLAFIVLLIGGLLIFAALALPFIGVGAVLLGGTIAYYKSPSYQEKKAKERTHELYQEAKKLAPVSWQTFVENVMKEVGGVDNHYADAFERFVVDVYSFEEFDEPEPPPPVCNSIEAARYRDRLTAYMSNVHSQHTVKLATRETAELLRNFSYTVPDVPVGDRLTTVPLHTLLDDLPRHMEQCIWGFFSDEVQSAGLFKTIRALLERNKAEQDAFPSEYKGDNIIWDYFRDTPLLELFQTQVPIALPQATRFEHMHVVAGSGHGKTQTLQYLISRDLHEDCSIVVIDSQGDLINNIAHLNIPSDRLVLIDPTDVEYPVCLNLFDVGLDRIKQYSPLDRERMINGIIELYDFVLGALLGAEMTQKQAVVFRYITRLMLYIPDATIHTLVDLMRPGAKERYAEHIEKVTGTARVFFDEEFDSKQFRDTKEQVLRRLYGILENQTFERMFSNPRSKVDLFTEMNEGKIILINTAKDLLKQTGTAIFGRFFIALITQAAQERATLPYKKPTFVYIDEAQDYFDDNIEVILSQARKQNIGLTLAHQYLGQLPTKLQQSLASNTSIKFAGGVSMADARVLAPQLRTSAEFIMGQKKGQFAAYIKGATETAAQLTISFGVMEKMDQTEDFAALRDEMRDKYAVPIDDLGSGPSDKSKGQDSSKDGDREPPRKPGPDGSGDVDNIDTGPSDTL